MAVGIITIYKSVNCGSYLQAYALAKALEKLEMEGKFIEYKFSDHVSAKPQMLKSIFKMLLKGDFKGIRLLLDRIASFKRSVEILDVIKPQENIDCCIIGSDTLWDVSREIFYKNYSFFWGMDLKNTKVISYAPSVGFAKEKDIEKCSFIQEALQKMHAVGVRDNISKSLLQPYCDKEIQVLCDPTYLIERDDYDAIALKTDLKDFLFIYYYGKMPADYKESIKRFAKEKNLKTIVFGNTNQWCDISLAYDPFLFLSLYAKADYIITNTFHGTVFATIYEKRFAVTKNDKPKIIDVLDMCGLSDKMADSAENIQEILSSDFDYNVVRSNILKERKKGFDYLTEVFEKEIK